MVKVSDQRKSERVKQYFAETAKEIILKEGVGAVSVRRTAADAGYSYATIYNHFENIDELLWYARDLLIGDVADYIKANRKDAIENVDDLKAMFRTYMDYFLENPNVYHFFYFHKLEKSEKKSQNITEGEEYQNEFMKPFQFLLEQGLIAADDIVVFTQTILYSTYGLLTLYISDNDQLTRDDLYHHLDESIDFLLRRKEK
jgi:AcrR family transcriptional regulator